MAQKLLLPFKAKTVLVSAGYQTPGYQADWGFPHYGHDLGFREAGYDTFACGAGEVVAAGLDGDAPYGSGANLGNCIVIVYRDVVFRDGSVRDVACQMCHFSSVSVRAGDRVDADTLIGQYGNTGAKNYTSHLHIQFDTDAANPRYMFGIARSGNILRKGSVNSSVQPALVLHRREGQTVQDVGYQSGDKPYVRPADLDMDEADEEDMVPRSTYEQVLKQRDDAFATLRKIKLLVG